jgi:hypothetical protein
VTRPGHWHQRYTPPPAPPPARPPSPAGRAALSGAARGALIGGSVTLAVVAQEALLAATTAALTNGGSGGAAVVGLGRIATALGTAAAGLAAAVPIYLAVWHRWRQLGPVGREGLRVVAGAAACWAVLAAVSWSRRVSAIAGGEPANLSGGAPTWLQWGIGPAVYGLLFAAAASGYARRGLWDRRP